MSNDLDEKVEDDTISVINNLIKENVTLKAKIAELTSNKQNVPCSCNKYGIFVKCYRCGGDIVYPIKCL